MIKVTIAPDPGALVVLMQSQLNLLERTNIESGIFTGGVGICRSGVRYLG